MLLNEKKINKLFLSWLIISLLLVLFIIIIGGLTRLTNSGLSITEWELFKGIIPPINSAAWEIYFSQYKQIPQYKLMNFNMSIDEFKVIFYWEYFHRFFGRLIGIFFLIPLIYFNIKKNINYKHLKLCNFIFLLIVIQGFVGWLMVKSGLVNNVSVSHYRLSLHLTIALIIISLLFWMILNIKNRSNKVFFKNKKSNYFFYFLLCIVFFQVILGAFVSGLDAGRLYQTWPLMNLNYFPDDVLIKKAFDFLNFDNHGLVQFYHRNLAYIIMACIIIFGFYIFKNDIRKLKKPFLILGLVLISQIILGIVTLLSGLNIYIASAHQIFSVLLILSTINLYYFHIK